MPFTTYYSSDSTRYCNTKKSNVVQNMDKEGLKIWHKDPRGKDSPNCSVRDTQEKTKCTTRVCLSAYLGYANRSGLLDHAALALWFLLEDNVFHLWCVTGRDNRSPLHLHCSGCWRFLVRTRSISISSYFVFIILLRGSYRWGLWQCSRNICCCNRRGCCIQVVCLIPSFIFSCKRQFRSHTARGWSDRFATLYHFDYLVGFSAQVPIRPKWVVPPTVSAENIKNVQWTLSTPSLSSPSPFPFGTFIFPN